jgi:hypothetical protein
MEWYSTYTIRTADNNDLYGHISLLRSIHPNHSNMQFPTLKFRDGQSDRPAVPDLTVFLRSPDVGAFVNPFNDLSLSKNVKHLLILKAVAESYGKRFVDDGGKEFKFQIEGKNVQCTFS